MELWRGQWLRVLRVVLRVGLGLQVRLPMDQQQLVQVQVVQEQGQLEQVHPMDLPWKEPQVVPELVHWVEPVEHSSVVLEKVEQHWLVERVVLHMD